MFGEEDNEFFDDQNDDIEIIRKEDDDDIEYLTDDEEFDTEGGATYRAKAVRVTVRLDNKAYYTSNVFPSGSFARRVDNYVGLKTWVSGQKIGVKAIGKSYFGGTNSVAETGYSYTLNKKMYVGNLYINMKK